MNYEEIVDLWRSQEDQVLMLDQEKLLKSVPLAHGNVDQQALELFTVRCDNLAQRWLNVRGRNFREPR